MGATHGLRAESTVLPHRFVAAGTADNSGIQAGDGVRCLGVSESNLRDPYSDYHAEVGDSIMLQETDKGHVVVECGEAVNPGTPVKSDATGRAAPAGIGTFAVGQALQAGVAGEKVAIQYETSFQAS